MIAIAGLGLGNIVDIGFMMLAYNGTEETEILIFKLVDFGEEFRERTNGENLIHEILNRRKKVFKKLNNLK